MKHDKLGNQQMKHDKLGNKQLKHDKLGNQQMKHDKLGNQQISIHVFFSTKTCIEKRPKSPESETNLLS